MFAWRYLAAPAAFALLLATGCAYRYYAGDIKPLSEALQGENKTVADDGTVSHTQGRLEISLRPMSDEELNRQFSSYSNDGSLSANPYTYANFKDYRTDETPRRFTVFRLRVSNYEYPKVYIDPKELYITTGNGRKYYALSFDQLWIYFRTYAGGGTGGDDPGIPGNTFDLWKERRGILRRTMYPDEQVFSAQETEGYVIFKPMAPDVSEITVHIPDVVVRFDFKGDPAETVDVAMKFQRDIGKVYPDGKVEVSKN